MCSCNIGLIKFKIKMLENKLKEKLNNVYKKTYQDKLDDLNNRLEKLSNECEYTDICGEL